MKKLTEHEIIERLERGVGRKRFKQLFAKLLKLNKMSPIRHLKMPKWESESDSCMAGTCFISRTLGFEKIIDERTMTEEYASLKKDCVPEVAEKIFHIAEQYFRE